MNQTRNNSPLAMPRPQFTIRTLLWLTLVVAAFLGGMKVGRERERSEAESRPFRWKVITESEWSQNGKPIP
jgi:hypothetical protein